MLNFHNSYYVIFFCFMFVVSFKVFLMKPIKFSVPQPNRYGCFIESRPFGRYGSCVNLSLFKIYVISIWLLEHSVGNYSSFELFYWFCSHYYGKRYKILWS